MHKLKIPFNRYDVSEIKKIHPHVQDTDFPVLKDSNVTLIGTDHAGLLLHRDFRQGQNRETKAVKIKLDWVHFTSKRGFQKKKKSLCNNISNSLANIDEIDENSQNF